MNERRRGREWSKVAIAGIVCGHQVVFKTLDMPKPGELVWCALCRKYSHRAFPASRDVDGNPVPGEWRWTCKSNCRIGMRCCGAGGERVAESQARKHWRSFPQHEVWIINPDGVVTLRWSTLPSQEIIGATGERRNDNEAQ